MRTRTAPQGPTVAEDAVEPGTNLRFNEALTWSAGKPFSTGDMLRRLGNLAKELKDLEQEDINSESLTSPAQDLATSNLLEHKDAGVRALVACCLVDVFRLCAPAAPFTTKQIKAIMVLFIRKIIPALSDPQNPYNSQHLYVLSSLSEYKSIVLVTDLPGHNELILSLFATCFDILASPDNEMSKNMEFNMTGMLCAIIEECQSLPNEVVEILLAQFLRADHNLTRPGTVRQKKSGAIPSFDPMQSTLRLKQLPPAYNMAKNICVSCVDRMTRYVSQYFSAVITEASRLGANNKSKYQGGAKSSGATSDDDEEHGPDDEGIKNLSKAHRLMRELWKAAPGVVQIVIPQIEAELSAENEQLRLLATETIGDMASGIGAAGPPPPPTHNPSAYPPQALAATDSRRDGQIDLLAPVSPQSFPQTHVSTYQSFLGRKNDKSSLIRGSWTKAVGYILSTSAGRTGLSPQDETQLATYLSDMLIDADEKVRLAAIDAIAMFELPDLVTKLGSLGNVDSPGSVLHNLADRVKDRKPAVRTAATLFLGQLWGVAYGEMSAGNERVADLLKSIPSRILEAIYVNDASIDALVDRVIFESLWPIGFPSSKKKEKEAADTAGAGRPDSVLSEQDADMVRTERLLFIVKDLDQRAKVAFLSRMARPKRLAEYMKAFLKRCEDFNGGVLDKGASDVRAQLNKIVDFWAQQSPDPPRAAEDLMKFAKANDRRNYSLMQFCMADGSDYKKMHRSMKELHKRLDGLSTTTGTLVQTITALLYRVTNLFYNRSHVHPIISFSQTDDRSLGAAAHEVLKELSLRSPGAFKVHSEELCKALEEQAPGSGTPIGPGALDNLKACAAFAKRFPGDIPNDRKFLQAISLYAMKGSPASTGKYAVTIILSVTNKKDMYARDLLAQCVKDFDYGSEGFMVKLACLSQIMLLAYTHLDEEKDVDPVVDIAINKLLLQNRNPLSEHQPLWENAMDEETEAKVWTLRILVNRLRAHDKGAAVKEIAAPAYQLLNNLVQRNGELSKENNTPPAQRSHLRLQAALLLLKLSAHHDFDGFLSTKAFNALATVAQDPAQQVRERFITKVKKYLGQDRLPSRFYAIVFLLAFEPSRKLREDTITWARARSLALSKQAKRTLDITFARFMSLLVHHPDFDVSEEELENLIKYIMFYLKAIATEENLSLIFHVAQQVKTKADAISPEMSESLYYLADLAAAVITQYEDFQGWSMQAYAGQVHLPSNLFKELPSDEVRQDIARKQYLPQQFQDRVEGLVKVNMRSMKKRKSDSEDDNRAKKRLIQSNAKTETQSKPTPVAKLKKRSKQIKKRPSTSEVEVEPPSSERRRSGRAAGRKSYTETAESDDDADMEVWNAEDNDVPKPPVVSRKKAQNGGAASTSDSDDDLSEAPDSGGESS